MGRRKESEHYILGYGHATAGLKPYKFQDPYLQGLYDEGWDDANSGRLLKDEFMRRVHELGLKRKERW